MLGNIVSGKDVGKVKFGILLGGGLVVGAAIANWVMAEASKAAGGVLPQANWGQTGNTIMSPYRTFRGGVRFSS